MVTNKASCTERVLVQKMLKMYQNVFLNENEIRVRSKITDNLTRRK